MHLNRRPYDTYRWLKGPLQSTLDGARRACADCGTTIRAYRYRQHPPESRSYERCIGFAWCSACRVFAANTVYVPRERALVDRLAGLPAGRREALLRKEADLVAHLDRTWDK
ncbi:hypothetical protein [Streptomyces roseicoloratus]|uniref:Uncharacterized protein n=1 Tax=Streptomyces roseicoloratus TaxID=2508722 RepID=A0ABY9S290_9ACTN|nr:hypothetical protein [Streptomyces roseicoloratus]WMX48551.1 hypothetical protein RGF97_32335 [Streptomyces roseicoloratus]